MSSVTIPASAALYPDGWPRLRDACVRRLRAGLHALSKQPPAPAVIALEQGATTWVEQPLGLQVMCDAGSLWLTHDNVPKDVILETGQSYASSSGSRLSIHALSVAQLRVI